MNEIHQSFSTDAEGGNLEIRFQMPSQGEKIERKPTHNILTIGKKIGDGNFSIVYGGSDIWGNELAIKVLKPKYPYPVVQNAFVKEFQQLFKMRHPFITYIHDAFEYRHVFYIVTERCDSTLADLMTVKNFEGQLWLRSIARCILQAVHFIHLNGYLHQDIHIRNVYSTLVRDELFPDNYQAFQFKLGDLGISRLITEVSARSTMANWMRPPEVLRPDLFGKPDRRVDIYHLGLMFLQLILGKEIQFTEDQILAGMPSQIARNLDVSSGKVLARALACKVQERIDSALLFWQELDKVLPRQTTAKAGA